MIHNVITTQICIELVCSGLQGTDTFWVIFVYASIDAQVRQQQWDYFVNKRPRWGDNWVLVGILMILGSRRRREGEEES